jgi:hypothetical protein
MKKEQFYVEYNGDYWQSVFPSVISEHSKLHLTIGDACEYIWETTKALKGNNLVKDIPNITIVFPKH